MCGGEGSRLDVAAEKPLFEIDGVPMVDRVIDALAASAIDSIFAVGSPAVPETAAHLEAMVGAADGGGLDGYIEGTGEGYVADLHMSMETVDLPVLTVAADLPLLDGPAIDWVLETYERGSLTVSVPVALKESLGVSVSGTTNHEGTTVTATGVNVVGDPEPELITMTDDTRFAVNVNRPRDAAVAEARR